MPSLLVVVFILQLTIHLINTIGAIAFNDILWNIYNFLRISSTSKTVAEQKALQTRFLQLRTELNATSSQDEFAKWAKLRRQHDKCLEELEKKKQTLHSTRTTFTTTTTTLRYLSTNGLRLLLQFLYTKHAMFYLPAGWIPYYAEWLLSFPRAPLGSVSIQAWCMACAAVIMLVGEGVGGGVALMGGSKVDEVKMGMGGEKEREGVKVGGDGQEKKEL